MEESDCALSVEEVRRLVEAIQANPANSTDAFDKLTTAFGKLVRWQAYKRHMLTLHEDLL